MSAELIEVFAARAGITMQVAGPSDGGIDTWFGNQYLPNGALPRFAALVAEECARACEATRDSGDSAGPKEYEDDHATGHVDGCNNSAAAIRALFPAAL